MLASSYNNRCCEDKLDYWRSQCVASAEMAKLLSESLLPTRERIFEVSFRLFATRAPDNRVKKGRMERSELEINKNRS